jgi:pullulanase/glycogen debranching enzyme
VIDLVRSLIRLRRDYPVLHRDRFVHGSAHFEPNGFTDIEWLRADGQTMQEAALVIVFNADPAAIDFVQPYSEFDWRCIFTTADKMPDVTEHSPVEIGPRSVQLFELQL